MTKEQMSRKLSYLLRHDEQMINEYGWADVSEIIRKMQEDVPTFDQTLLSEIIAEDKKRDTVTGPINGLYGQIKGILCQ